MGPPTYRPYPRRLEIKYNHLQMKLQRQHFLLSYLKTLSVGSVGVLNSRPPALQPSAQPSDPLLRGTFDLIKYVTKVGCFRECYGACDFVSSK